MNQVGKVDSNGRFPVTRDLRLVYVFSLVIALLLAAASVLGIVFQTDLHPAEAVRPFGVPTDIISLTVALPILIRSMRSARRGTLVGLLCWPGILLYVPYINLVYVFGVPFGSTFPLYLVLVTLSAYTLIGLVASVDAKAVQQRLAGAVPIRTAGALLMGLDLLFIAIQVPDIIPPLWAGRIWQGSRSHLS